MNSVVLLTVDCLRSDHLGCYGYDRSTSPNIDSFADSATIFSNAYSNCPGTRWAFQSIHTGVSTAQFSELGVPTDYQPLAAHLHDAGYHTGGFANNGWVSRDFNYNQGFDTYYSVRETRESKPLPLKIGKRLKQALDFEFITENILRPARRVLNRFEKNSEGYYKEPHTDADMVNEALAFIENNKGCNNDYFLWLHLMNAHTPYSHWPEHRDAVSDTTSGHTQHPGKDGLVTKGETPDQLAIDTYDACVRSVDEQIGRVLDTISDETSVVLTGDHGEEFGRYGEFHDASLYSSMTNVPIIAKLPGLNTGTIRMPATHLDISATVLSLAGVDIPEHWEGKPLTDDEVRFSDPVFFSLGTDEVAVQTDKWKYIRRGAAEELYQMGHGGREMDAENVAENHPNVINNLSQMCDARLESGSLDATSRQTNEEQMSEIVEQNLEDLGYL